MRNLLLIPALMLVTMPLFGKAPRVTDRTLLDGTCLRQTCVEKLFSGCDMSVCRFVTTSADTLYAVALDLAHKQFPYRQGNMLTVQLTDGSMEVMRPMEKVFSEAVRLDGELVTRVLFETTDEQLRRLAAAKVNGLVLVTEAKPIRDSAKKLTKTLRTLYALL